MPDTEKLSWDEIRRRYPDEFVVLVETEHNDVGELSGIVVSHGKDKVQMRQVLRELNPASGGCLWTGAPRGLISPLRPGEAR